MQIEDRWGAASPDDMRKHAAELVALAPDAVLASGTMSVTHVLQATPSSISAMARPAVQARQPDAPQSVRSTGQLTARQYRTLANGRPPDGNVLEIFAEI